MIIRKLIYSLTAFLLLSGSGFCFAGKSRHEKIPFNDSSITVITCREIDSLSAGIPAFRNTVDQANPLKIFHFVYSSGAMTCKGINDLSEEKTLTENGDTLLVYVHGHYKSFEDAAVSGLRIQNLYHIKVIVYSWPAMLTSGPGSKNYLNSRMNAELGASKFRELLILLQKFRESDSPSGNRNHLNLCLHSLGNYFLERMVKDSLLYSLDNDLFDNIIMSAPAVTAYGHSAWLDKINIQKRVYVTCNRKDFNLAGVKTFTDLGTQLGKEPGSPLSTKAKYIDFTKAVGFRLPTGATHNYFTGKMALKNNKIKEFFDEVFRGNAIKLDDPLKFRHERDMALYDLIP